MLSNVEIIWKEGIPKDTTLMTVPRTGYWLECKKWLNGRFQVSLLDPMTDYRKVVWRSIPESELDKIVDQLCILGSHNPKSPVRDLLHDIRKMRSKKAPKKKS